MSKEKICPLMSRAVTISDYRGNPGDRVTDIRYENCAKENCAWWINMPLSIDVHSFEGCAIKRIAEKSHD